MPNLLLEKLFSKPTADTIGATLPWTAGGALGGAALGAGSYALQDEEQKKHDSLMKSMMLGAGLGATAGTGIKALGGLRDPSTLKTTDIVPPPAPPVSNTRSMMALMAQHPTATGLGAGAATWGATRGAVNKGIEQTEKKLSDVAADAGKAANKATTAATSHAAKSPILEAQLKSLQLTKGVQPSALKAMMEELTKHNAKTPLLQAESQALQAAAKNAPTGMSGGSKLMARAKYPVAATLAAGTGAGALKDFMQRMEAYNAANQQLGGAVQ